MLTSKWIKNILIHNDWIQITYLLKSRINLLLAGVDIVDRFLLTNESRKNEKKTLLQQWHCQLQKFILHNLLFNYVYWSHFRLLSYYFTELYQEQRVETGNDYEYWVIKMIQGCYCHFFLLITNWKYKITVLQTKFAKPTLSHCAGSQFSRYHRIIKLCIWSVL